MNKELPTHQEWLKNWFTEIGGKAQISDLANWMPNGLFRHKELVINALEEIGCKFNGTEIIYEN